MQVTFFKARKDNTGSALQFRIAEDNGNVFMTMFPQTGERSFNWEKRIFVSLNASEMGEMLAVIEGYIGGCGKPEEKDGKTFYQGFYHKTPNSNSSIKFAKYNDGFATGLRSERNGTSGEYKCILTIGEAFQLRELLRRAIQISLELGNKRDEEGTGSTPPGNGKPATATPKPSRKTGGTKGTSGPVAPITSDDEIPF